MAQAYLDGQAALSKGTLRLKERQVVQLLASQMNGCEYCIASHGTSSLMAGITPDDAKKMAQGGLPADPDLAAIGEATRLIVDQRGNLSADQLADLEARGVTRQKLFEIITLVAMKLITNYVSHVTEIELDERFEVFNDI